MKENLNIYFGIDFGTTSCAVVGYYNIDGEIKAFKCGDEEGRPIPSVVAINTETGEVFTGREAWEQKMELQESCEYISSVKSILDGDWSKVIAGRKWTPVDVATVLFKSLRDAVQERIHLEMKEATVAIPIGFSAEKRRKLRDAAKMAGIDITAFVSEPTAAFFANYDHLKSASIITVFDWGGGTLDVSVIQNDNGRIVELATEGMHLAGDDIDRQIAQKMHDRIARKKNKKCSFDDMSSSAKDLMLVRSERAKRELCDEDEATISINNYGVYGTCREILDYDWFSSIIEPDIDAAMECLKKAISQSELGIDNIDAILMVGGSSNLIPLYDRMVEYVGNDEEKLYYPDETMWNVGEGAAKLAMIPGNYYSSQDIDIILSDGSHFNLLKKDTPLNQSEKNCSFGLVDLSKEARFVFGGSKDIEESSDKYQILSIPTYRFLEEKLELHTFVDENMIFCVHAKSNMRTNDFARVWEYPYLKCYYKLKV